MDSRLLTLLGNAPNLAGVNPVSITSSTYAMSDIESVLFVSTASNAVTITAPNPTTRGRTFTICKTNTGANGITLARYGTETIQGAAASYSIPGSNGTSYPTFTFVSDGTNWWQLDAYQGATAGGSPLAVYPTYGTIAAVDLFCDFLGNGSTNGHFAPFNGTTSGTGSTFNPATATGGRVGIVTLETGTTTAGYATVWTNADMIQLGNGTTRYRADINIPTASDGTNTYTVRTGFSDASFTAGVPADGVFFRYTHSENSGNWTCVTRANSVEITTNSGVAAVHASAYRVLEIEVNAAASSANFRIDGVSVATHVANIPSGAGRETGVTSHIVKSAGTTSRLINLDCMYLRLERTTAL